MPNTRNGYWTLVEPYWKAVDIYRGPGTFLRTFAEVPQQSGVLLAAHWCQSEVRNGGFHQFFTNSTGVLAPEALVAFAAIGRPDLADLLQRAMSFFDSPYPRDQHARITALPDESDEEREEWDPFSEIDDEFFSCLERETFEDSADRFARNARA